MKPPARTLKRKRPIYPDDDIPEIKTKILRPNKSQPEAIDVDIESSQPQDITTSETSGLTSADDVATVTSATGIDSDGSKFASESGHPSGQRPLANGCPDIIDVRSPIEENRMTEIVTAYRKATDVLIEVTSRLRHTQYGDPFVGFRGPYASNSIHASTPVNHLTTPYANVVNGIYSTPYANPEPMQYVTPYANPPVVTGASAHGRSSTSNDHGVLTAGFSIEKDHTIKEAPKSASKVFGKAKIDVSEPNETSKDKDSTPVSVGMLDGFLALANGGILPGQEETSEESENCPGEQRNLALFAPPSPGETIDENMSRADDDIQALVTYISNDLTNRQEPLRQAPPANPYAAIYSSMNGKQLGAELKRMVDIIQPEINAVIPREQIQVAHLFYTHLASCIGTWISINTHQVHPNSFGPPAAMNQWSPAPDAPPPPNGHMVSPTGQWQQDFAPPQPAPQPHPLGPRLAPRNNIIDVNEERKMANFGSPPIPSPKSGLRSKGKSQKRRLAKRVSLEKKDCNE